VVGVVMGGWGEEREVSLKTGEAVAKALEGRGIAVERIVAGAGLDTALRAAHLDVAFLALHGRCGEDGSVQGLCEVLGVPYTGSGVLASALAMDKPMAKKVLRYHNLPTPWGYVASKSDMGKIEQLHGDMGYPCIVKPASSGSSFGLSLVKVAADLPAAVEKALAFGGKALVERFVKGKEVTVAVLDGQVLGTCEIVPPAELYSTDVKYAANSGSKYHTPARVSATRLANLEALARGAYVALGCRGLARVDLIASDQENDFILEVNTLPGMTATSLAPKIAAQFGWSFGELCERILDAAALDRPALPAPATVVPALAPLPAMSPLRVAV
jgi:D-alanine-D-alanine ligase